MTFRNRVRRNRLRRLIVESLEDRRVLTASAELFMDINIQPAEGSPAGFVQLGDRALMVGLLNPDINNLQYTLISSDGTEAGTVRLPGPTFSPDSPDTSIELTPFDNQIYFAGEFNFKEQLWRTDGTVEGTVPVADINPSGLPYISSLTPVGDTLFFVARNDDSGEELWKYDAISGTANIVKDIHLGSTDSSPRLLTNVNGVLYFVADDGSSEGRQIWTSDGTETGTLPVTSIAQGFFNNSFSDLTAVNSTLYFSAYQDSYGTELWAYQDNSFYPLDVLPGIGSSDPQSLTAIGSYLYFSAHTPGNVRELFRSEASSLSLEQLTTSSGGDSTIMQSGKIIVPFGDGVMFPAFDPTTGEELATWDPILGFQVIDDIEPGNGSSSPRDFTPVGGTIYFTANTDQYGRELWSSDGTPAGTTLVADQSPGSDSSIVRFPTAIGDKLWASIEFTSEPATDTELLIVDSVTAQSSVLQLAPGNSDGGAVWPTVANNRMYFSGFDGFSNKTWVSDGTTEGTTAFPTTINNGAVGIAPLSESVALMAGRSGGSGAIYRTDGTVEGTQLVKVLESNPSYLTQVGSNVYFRAQTSTTGAELWISDGTEAGTRLVKDIIPGAGSGDPIPVSALGDQLVFAYTDPLLGRELWITDGTDAGTRLLYDIRPGSDSSVGLLSQSIAVGNKLFFPAVVGTNPTHVQELWVTDGTESGTKRVTDDFPGKILREPNQFAMIENRIYFYAIDENNDQELHYFDTDSNNPPVKINTNPSGGSSRGDLAVVNDTVYFVAGTFENTELWRSDGTLEGTFQVAEINPIGSSSPRWFFSVGNELVFMADDGGTEPTLWKTDGTPDGTGKITGDFTHLRDTRLFSAVFDNSFYFSAQTENYGFEILRYTPSSLPTGPTDILLSNSSIAENSPAASVVGNLSTPQAGSDTFTYALVSGAGSIDNDQFEISGNQLIATNPFDYETATTKSIRIRVTDQNNQTFEKASTINVTNVDEPPTNFTLSNTSVLENLAAGALVGLLQTNDPEGDAGITFTFSPVGGDNNKFSLSGNQLLTAELLDAETGSTSFGIAITASNGLGWELEKDFFIELLPVNDNPPEFGPMTIDPPNENSTFVGILEAFDYDVPPQPLTYSVVGGDDADLFTVVGNELRFITAPNFEAPSDADNDNSYSVTVRVHDGLFFADEPVSFFVNDINEAPTDITLSTTLVPENLAPGTVVADITVTDPDLMDIDWTISLASGAGDTDNGQFLVVGNQLTVDGILDFETKSSLSIRLIASDMGGESFEKVFTITVTDVDEGISNFVLQGNTLQEELPAGSTVGSFASIGAETVDTTFTLTGTNTDNSAFTIEGNVLKSATVLDAEQQSYYLIEVEATANGTSITRQFAVLLSPLNEFAPVLTSGRSLSFLEGVTFVTRVTSSDSDFAPSAPNLSIGGEDAALFQVVGNEIRFIDPPDFENPLDTNGNNFYYFVLTLTEGSLSNTYGYTVSVENINDPPTAPTLTDLDYPNLIFPENTPTGTTIGLFNAFDADGPDVPSYRFVSVGGANDNSSFEIVGGELRTTRLFDYEDPADRELTIQVVAYDFNGATSAPVTFTLGVSDGPEPPTALPAEYSLNRNTSLPITLAAEESGGALTYQITQQPVQGTLSGSLPNLTYTPNTNYIGADEFFFRVLENGVPSFEARVSLVVQGVRPMVTIMNAGPFNESVGTVPVQLLLTEPSDIDLWVELTTLPSGTAVADSDYDLVSTSVFVPAGTTMLATPLAILDDNADEQNETVVLSIVASVLYETDTLNHTFTIVDNDDAPTISLVANNLVVNESPQTIRARLSLSAPSHQPITIPFSLGGTANNGQDYNYSPADNIVRFNPGSTEAWVQIPIIDDSTPEPTESITVNFGSPSYGSYANGASGLTFNAFLRDNDLRTISMERSFVTVDENVGTVRVTATIDTTSDTAIVVPAILSGNATIGGANADYTTQFPVSFVFQPGQSTAHVDLSIFDDSSVELVPESVVLSLGESSSNSFRLGTQKQTSITIRDNDRAQLSFTVSERQVWENAGSFTLTATLDRAVPTSLNIPLVITSTGSAVATRGVDYNLTSNSLFFAANQTSASVTVIITNDTLNESLETFRVGVSSPGSNAPFVLGRNQSVLAKILDNDPILRVTPVTSSVTESTSSRAQFRFTLSAPTNQTLTIPVTYSGTARAGSDYTAAASNTITLPAGQTSATVSLAIRHDTLDEANETITASVKNAIGAIVDARANSATVTITDNDTASVDFNTPNSSGSEASVLQRVGSFTSYVNRKQPVVVKLSTPVDRDTSVSLAFSGRAVRNVDYKVLGLTNDRLLIKAGNTTATFQLEIVNDSGYEGNEGINVSIIGVSSPVVKPRVNPVRTFTIIDNDKPPAPPKPPIISKTVPPALPNTSVGTLAIDLNPATGSYPIDSAAVATTNIGISPIGVGTVAIWSGNQGALLGSTAFFDANFNGVIDFIDADGDAGEEELAEPSVETQIDGSFALVIDEFDLDGSGAVEPDEGRIVLTGGVDISIGLPLNVPLAAPVGIFNITPASTLAESLVRTQGFTVEDALTRVAEALQVPNYDFSVGNAMYQTLENDVLAGRTYNAMVQLYSSVVNVAQYLAGISGRDLLPTAQGVMDVVGELIASEGSTLDFTSESTIATILSSASETLLIEIDPDGQAVVASVVAGGTSRMATLAITDEVNGESFLQQLYKVKKVVQGAMADAMFAFGEGSLTGEQLQTQFSGEGLDSKINAAEVSVTVPPAIGINSLGLVESNSGSSVMRFSVSMVGNHNYPVSVDFASVDNTATAGVDYTAVTGTLQWAAGDSSERFIDVPIHGDTLFEDDESFSILLSNGNGLVIREAVGTGFILNDDSLTLTSNAVEESTTEVYVALSDERLEISENRTPVVSGEFARGTTINYVGSDTSSQNVIIDAGSNRFRNDQFTFAAGNQATFDQFSVIGGEFGAIEYTIVDEVNQYVRLFSSDLTTHVDVTLTDFELASLPVSSVETVVVRVPSSFGSVTFEPLQGLDGAEGTENQLVLVHPSGSTLPGFSFQRPNTKLLVLGIGGEVDVIGEDLGVQVESAPAGIYLPTTVVNENRFNANLGMLQSKEIGFDGSVELLLVPGEQNRGSLSIINTNQLRADGTIDYETTPELSQLVRMTNGLGETLDWQVSVDVNNLVEFATENARESFTVGNGTAQRSRVKELVIQLDQEVEIQEGAFTLNRVATNSSLQLQYFPVTTAVQLLSNNRVRLTFSGSQTVNGALNDGYYVLDIDATKVRSATGDQPLDAQRAGQASSYQFGAEEADKFFSFFGDGNGDGDTDRDDFNLFRTTYRKRLGQAGFNSAFDYDGDNDVDASDYAHFNRNYGKQLPSFPLGPL